MKRIFIRSICLLMILFLMFTAACNKNAGSDEISGVSGDKIIVAVTIVPEQTFVEAVCGDLAEVITMVPPGYSPENYEPSPKDMIEFSKADIYFAIGVPVEEASILSETGDMDVVYMQNKTAAVYPEREFTDGERDPHIWLSPKRVIVIVETIAEEMGRIDKENKDIYAENAEEYIKLLEEVDHQITSALEDVVNKKFICYHPAFGYLADDYGLEMYALEDEGKEAAPKHLEEMIDLAKQENIKVIFYQEEIDSSQSEAFAEEIGGKTIQLSPLAADYIENLKNMAELMAEVMR